MFDFKKFPKSENDCKLVRREASLAMSLNTVSLIKIQSAYDRWYVIDI